MLYNNILDEKDKINSDFLKMFDDEIVNFIEDRLNKEIELGNIKKCNANLTAYIIYHIYLLVMFEYDNELNEDEVAEQMVSILKDGLVN